MEGEVGAQVAPPIFVHQSLPGRFHEPPPLAKKRDLPWQNPSLNHQRLPNPNGNWNPKLWDWDSVRFTAKPSSDASEVLNPGTQPTPMVTTEAEQNKKGKESPKTPPLSKGLEEEGEILTLKLGGGLYSVEEPVARPNKRVRSGSPGNGGGSFPMCQVDDCRADLSNAKDYHRRHKVCEIHSKTTKALVGKQMQRFCQQCSRFHPLSEFDEGKRSCRRRLAGHNRRRRKMQPEDASSRLLAPGSQENSTTNGSMDVVNLLSMLARLQGNTAGKQTSVPPLPDRDHLIQILSKLNSLPSKNASPKSPSFDLNVSQASELCSFEQSWKANGNPSAPSTMDLLAVLSAALAASAPDVLVSLSQGSSYSSGDDKTRMPNVETATDANSHNKPAQIFPSVGVVRSSCNNGQSPGEAFEARPSLHLKLFGSAEDDSPPKLGSSVKYFSSESSNPMEDRSPSSSPPVQKFFPLHSGRVEDNGTVEASTSRGWTTPLDLLKESGRQVENRVSQSLPFQRGYASSSASDHSPSSSNSDAQDRTGRIIFKLFDRDPSNLPATLRTQIIDWLSHSPSEMESYIRPGCLVLSVYVSMPALAWDELEEEFLQRVTSLLQCSDSEFWKNGRFLVRTSRQLVAHKDGRLRLCKSWKTWSAPELTSVSPVAVVSGQETSLVLRGRNLTIPGTKIHCTYMGGYTSKEVLVSAYPGTIYDWSSLESFSLPAGSPDAFGRCFIEVENVFKGNSFPVIIADASICQELRTLESEFEEESGTGDVPLEDQIEENTRPALREDVLHFLNELGWLFQRKNNPSPCFMDFSITRFKLLITFSVDRDWSSLIRTLLDVLVERSSGNDALLPESFEMLLEIQLLSRAVKRKCRKMVDLLLNYSMKAGTDADASKVYPFPPNSVGAGGVTPLHIAASTPDSEGMVDALTNDPQEIGLNCWNSIQDENGQSPYMYASMRNNHSYNRLVATKLADRRNCQVSIAVKNEEISMDKSWAKGEDEKQGDGRARQIKSCAQCHLMETRRSLLIFRSRGVLQRPYVHSMLAIAAVCVCVCLCFRGLPQIGSVAPFKWENLEFGPR